MLNSKLLSASSAQNPIEFLRVRHSRVPPKQHELAREDRTNRDPERFSAPIAKFERCRYVSPKEKKKQKKQKSSIAVAGFLRELTSAKMAIRVRVGRLNPRQEKRPNLHPGPLRRRKRVLRVYGDTGCGIVREGTRDEGLRRRIEWK